jgi:hypothetical protein
MPAIVHLIKEAGIVSGAILPFEQLSEEAQESRNKCRSTAEVIWEKCLLINE